MHNSLLDFQQDLSKEDFCNAIFEEKNAKHANIDVKLLYKLTNQLEQIIGRCNDKEYVRAVYAQWKAVAAILDTFFFWLLAVLMAMITIVVLVVIPLTTKHVQISYKSILN